MLLWESDSLYIQINTLVRIYDDIRFRIECLLSNEEGGDEGGWAHPVVDQGVGGYSDMIKEKFAQNVYPIARKIYSF